MAADEHLGVQFEYRPVETGGKPLHMVTAIAGPTGTEVGKLLWNSREVRNITVDSDQQRRGVATGMWTEAQRIAAENARIPAPKHSTDRTEAGDAWARSVGGRLPRRKRDAG